MAKRKIEPSSRGPMIYSYIRFSTPEQAMGDSERRQLEAARAFAAEKGLPFDESLRMTDRGVSAYRGTHRSKGALGHFLARVERGEVPPGSVLVVENVDRLTREAMVDALTTILLDMIGHGITIQTLAPRETYNRESLNNHAIYGLIGQVARAHDESKRKSSLGIASWDEKRRRALEDGRPLTKRVPKWLVCEGGVIKAIPEAAKAIRMIFKLKLKGYGKGRIAKTLNAEAPWPSPSGTWRDSYISKILATPAVIGVFQPHTGKGKNREPAGEPIPGYYPPVVNKEDFHAVQKLLRANKGKGGPTGKASNLFVHLVKCAYCGGSMVWFNKGTPPKGGTYLMCSNGRRGLGCRCHSIRYAECETTILQHCIGLRPEQVLPDPDEQAKQCSTLQQRLSGIEGELLDKKTQIDNFTDQIGHTEKRSSRDRYENRIAALEAATAKLQEQRNAVLLELDRAERQDRSFVQWQKGLKGLRAALKRRDDVELRLRLRAHLRELIDKIEVFTDGFNRLAEERKPEHGPAATKSRAALRARQRGHEKSAATAPPRSNGQDVEDFAQYILEITAEHAPELLRSKKFSAFLGEVTDKRMSKKGRFLRIHFKTGIVRDVVPEGSIGSGRGLEVDEDGTIGWRVVQPDIDELWRRYKGRGRV